MRNADGGPFAVYSTWQYTPIGNDPTCERGLATHGPVGRAAASTSRPLSGVDRQTYPLQEQKAVPKRRANCRAALRA